jgi:putative colanic acid biosynthesis UDP-glucose lipid carrier transferase
MLHTKPSLDFMRESEALATDGAAVLSEEQWARRKWPINYDSVELVAITCDIAIIVASSVFSGFLYQLLSGGTEDYISKCIGSAILVSALFISLMKTRGMYNPTELLILPKQIQSTCTTWVTVTLLLAGAIFALKIGSNLSRGTSILFAMIGLVALILQRRAVKSLLARGLAQKRFSGRNIVLITDEASKDEAVLAQALIDTGSRVRMNFVLPPPGAARSPGRELAASVIEYVRGSDVEEILVGANPERWSDLRALVGELRVLPFPVSYIPVGPTSEIFKRPRRELGDAICLELQRGLLTVFERAAKRSIDIIVAGTALISLLPLLAIVAIAIKLDSPGPVLFRQRRCGFNGKYFQIRKFRTMSVLEDDQSIVQARKSDKRFTRLGVWLRRTSIDELPQLLNVLDGSMSLVGPRPHAAAHDNEFDKVVQNYAFRRRVKPGLTGWAQVHGCRGPTPTAESVEQRVEFDLWYIDNWSLSLDMAILLWTPIELVRGRNAY